MYDGGGLDPDIVVKTEPTGSAVIELIRSGLIFDFATKYCNEHPVVTNFQGFHLSPADFQQFESWMKQQHFTYSTELEKYTGNLVAAAKKERYYEELQTNLNALQAKIEQNHSAYMERFRIEIQQILEEEIAFHYGLNKGKTEVMMSRDKEITEAKRILNDAPAYQKLLMPQ